MLRWFLLLQAEDGIPDHGVRGLQLCALRISAGGSRAGRPAREPPAGGVLRRQQAGARRRRRGASGSGAVKLAIAGAGGRMGQAVTEAILADPELELVAALEMDGSAAIGRPVGKLKIGSDPAVLSAADCLIDFTRPEGTLTHLRHAKAMVIGTTGFSDAQRKSIAEAAKRMPIVMAANFAVGVNAAYRLAETAAQILGDAYDVEIVEAHHPHQVDAPSGTAL